MESDDDEDTVIYDEAGEVVYDPAYERMKVPRVCDACDAHFMGMPDHGYCDSCADKRERGWDI